jgi:hypothetical protein
MIDLIAISAIERNTELSYVRRERDWLARARAEGREVPATRLLPMLPTGVTSTGNGHGSGHGSSNGAHGDGAGAHHHGH